jgi:hypothetical protein
MPRIVDTKVVYRVTVHTQLLGAEADVGSIKVESGVTVGEAEQWNMPHHQYNFIQCSDLNGSLE